MKTIIYTHLTICLLLICGCTETVVDFPMSSDTKQLVLGAVLAIDGFDHQIYIGETKHISTSRDPFDATGTSCTITTPNGDQYDFNSKPLPPPNSTITTNMELSSQIPDIPGSYQLTVSHPEFDTVIATTTNPSLIPIDTAYIVGAKTSKPQFIISFVDPPEINYYQVKLQGIAYGRRVQSFDLNTADVAADNYFDTSGPLISDETFQGSKKTIVFDLTELELTYLEPKTAILISMTSDLYDFEKSARLAEEARRHPYLSEPPIISNVQNGHGIFALTKVDTMRVEL